MSLFSETIKREKQCEKEKTNSKKEKKKMFFVKFFLLAGVIGIGCVNCILTRANLDEKGIKESDNTAAQSIDRDYVVGYEDNYGHGSYGLSAHAHYGFPEVHGGYGVVEGGKHHIHHTDDHHHHHHDHDRDHYKHYSYDHHKALAIKSLLVPLAGVALLGAAAAFVSNPILLQLGVISGTSLGRKKRDLNGKPFPLKSALSQENRIRLNELKLLEKFMAQVPKQNVEIQEKKMLADYFSCTTMKNLCLERLACELHSAEGISMPMEANVLKIVVKEILENNFIADDIRFGLSKAVERGKRNFGCQVYECEELENRTDQLKN